MVEQQIEQRVIDKIKSALSSCVESVQVFGQLQSTPDELKGMEDSKADAFVAVKASPRSYSTATIPTCEIQVQVNAVIRADKDFDGKTYLDANNAMMEVFENWQKCYDDTHEDFTLSDFSCSGFRLDQGSFQVLTNEKAWNYQQGMTIFGVVQ